MEAFDVFYYSVSPTVTSLVTRCSLLCAFIEALLYPMIWTLRFASVVFDALSFMPELAMIVSGLVASALISVTYATPLIVFTRKRSYQYRWER